MDTTLPTTLNNARSARDHGIHRRAYLDTYAKRRAGIVTGPVELPRSERTTVQSTPDLPVVDELVPEMQPPVTGSSFEYVVDESLSQSTAIAEPIRTTYLDTLNQRNSAALTDAPQAEDTVMRSMLSAETEDLLEEPNFEDEVKIEANLGALYGEYSLTNQLANNSGSASAAHIRTIVASSFACGVIALSIFGVLGKYSSQPVVAQPIDSPVIEVDGSNVRPPGGANGLGSLADIPQTDPQYPVRVLIGGIGVNAPAQTIGTTKDGLIDVPQSYGIVGWYNKSSVPGKPGPAVLVGHYTGGNGGVFDKLKDLNNGDLVTVTNGKGQTFTYKVTAKNEYQKDAVPMAELFKSSSESKLQIITCSGKWQSKNYNKRLVVTAEIVR